MFVCLIAEPVKGSSDMFYLAGESIFAKHLKEKNPYVKEEYVNRKYDVLQKAYNLDKEFTARKDESEVLLIGVGRGYSALEMAIKYPKLKITAVNKEKYLYRADEIGAYFKRFYSEERVDEALSRISIKVSDIEEDVLGQKIQENYDVIIFETNVLMYMKEKLLIIEELFNDSLKDQGALFFGTDAIYGTQESYGGRSEKSAPDSLFYGMRSAMDAKGHLMAGTQQGFFGPVRDYRMLKQGSEEIIFPYSIHQNLTSFESRIAKSSNSLLRNADVFVFLSVYEYERRTARLHALASA